MNLRLPMLANVLCCFVCCGQLRAQLSQPPPAENVKRYTVTGTVVNSATGEPIRRAVVHLNGRGQLSAFTGPDGRFEMTGVPEGQVFVTAEKPGFFNQQSLHLGGYVSIGSNVGPGTNEFRIQLTPESTIRGRALDEDGEPIAQLAIQVFAEDIIEGRKQVYSRGSVITNDDGTYRVDNLVPGRYFLRTTALPIPAPSWNARPGVYPPEYYPNAPDRLTAQPIDLKPGEQTEADFTLHQSPGFNISGVIAGLQNGISVWYQGPDGQETLIAPAHFNNRTGEFALRGIPAGSWTLRFRSNDGHGDTYYAQQDVVVKSDVSGLQVLLQPAPEIPVIVNHASTTAVSGPHESVPVVRGAPGVQVQLIPENSAQMQSYYAAPRPDDQQGPLFVRGVVPARYKVAVQAFGTECVDSVTMGSVDLSRTDLLIAPGARPEPIVIGLRSDCGSISGAIRSEDPNGQAFALLVPDSPSAEAQTQPVQANAGFAFWNLRAGTYRVYAFSDLQGLEYANPEVLNSYSGQQVTIAPNQNAKITVDLIGRKSN